jgi:hypothetical protein
MYRSDILIQFPSISLLTPFPITGKAETRRELNWIKRNASMQMRADSLNSTDSLDLKPTDIPRLAFFRNSLLLFNHLTCKRSIILSAWTHELTTSWTWWIIWVSHPVPAKSEWRFVHLFIRGMVLNMSVSAFIWNSGILSRNTFESDSNLIPLKAAVWSSCPYSLSHIGFLFEPYRNQCFS